MREINQTFYNLLKIDSESGMNVSQVLTDELVNKSKAGEAKASPGADTNLKRIAKKQEEATKPIKTVPKSLKASGAKKHSTLTKKKIISKFEEEKIENEVIEQGRKKFDQKVIISLGLLILALVAFVYVELNK